MFAKAIKIAGSSYNSCGYKSHQKLWMLFDEYKTGLLHAWHHLCLPNHY